MTLPDKTAYLTPDEITGLSVGPDYAGWSSQPAFRDLIGLLAGNEAVLRYSDDGQCSLFTPHGRVNNTDIVRMLNNGWLDSYNGGYRLTDAGRLAFMRSTDEMGDGKLYSPEAKP